MAEQRPAAPPVQFNPITAAVGLPLEDRLALCKEWPERAEGVLNAPSSEDEWNGVGRDCEILETLISEAGFDAIPFAEFHAAMPSAREWALKLKGLTIEDYQRLTALLERGRLELRKLTAKLKGEIVRQLAAQPLPVQLRDDGTVYLGGVPDDLQEDVGSLVNQQFNEAVQQYFKSEKHWHKLSREQIEPSDRCRMTLTEASHFVGADDDGLRELIQTRLLRAFPDTSDVWTFSRNDLQVRQQLIQSQEKPVGRKQDMAPPEDGLFRVRFDRILEELEVLLSSFSPPELTDIQEIFWSDVADHIRQLAILVPSDTGLADCGPTERDCLKDLRIALEEMIDAGCLDGEKPGFLFRLLDDYRHRLQTVHDVIRHHTTPRLAPTTKSKSQINENDFKGGDQTSSNWMTISEAESISGINRGVISRAANAEDFMTNGETGRDRRIDRADFTRWQQKRAAKPEPRETSQSIQKKLDGK